MIAMLALLLAQFPSASQTNWMEPASFRLLLGDSRENVEAAFTKRGWTLDPGETPEVALHEYGEGKTVAMIFHDGHLTSVRFERVTFRAELKNEWSEITSRLRKRFSNPDTDRPSLFLVRTEALTIHAVLNDGVESELGKQGLGMIIVRYFVPSPSADPAETSRCPVLRPEPGSKTSNPELVVPT